MGKDTLLKELGPARVSDELGAISIVASGWG
jgi:hypothetical protein